MKQHTLTIDLNNDYRINIDNNLNYSFFKDVYIKAKELTDDIIKKNKQSSERSKLGDFDKDVFYNNVIAFVGDRGTGKSSAMTSFARALILKSNTENTIFFKGAEQIGETEFVSIETIDPSLFDQRDNLLQIIISKMFSKFEKTLRDTNRQIDTDKKRNLIRLFNDVYENLKTINHPNEFKGEAIDELSKLALGSNLRVKFMELVRSFNNFFANNDSKKSHLIICIDDFDLNIAEAYDMLEDVRKYLTVENVIVFISCKIEQLLNDIEEKILSKYQYVINFSNLIEQPKQSGEKYLEKVIPSDRRLYLPELKRFNKNNILDIEIVGDPIKYAETSIEAFVMGLIHKKSGLFIIPSNYYIHPATPYSLRAFINSYQLYNSLTFSSSSLFILSKNLLKEATSIKNDYITYDRNDKELLKEDAVTYHSFLEDLDNFNLDILNKNIIFFLLDNDFIDENLSENSFINSITSNLNNPKNISFGDLINILRIIQISIDPNQESSYIFLYC
ncbi:hypothetical protein CJD36_016335 [Flavipsychrobacter stenotrophus]|uniref:Uncharacterized protein n=1 Tax=Flavipsychrobacter stenotrophus TaxID=2077091 RepID=A0A2S7STJ0_9BACT|nr:hypothetical protein [Flavipsychrobacter stenotrophus]PQJ10252.1 hypothetical protein CJD36_016335 [Flavipsychrobacter stenotrophus]